MNNLERYLNQATRGICGRRKLEIREELESDILERTRKHELLGCDYQHAIEHAILELGDARALSNGMKGVYVMPNLIRSSILATVIFAGTVAVLTSSNAQVSVTTIKNPQGDVFRLFLDVKSFAKELETAGFSINTSRQGFEMNLSGKRAFVPWTEYNSRVFQGQQELDIWNAFGALERAGIAIKHVNETQKLAYQINDTEIVLKTSPEISENWNTSFAKRWATSFFEIHAKIEEIIGQSFRQDFNIKTSKTSFLAARFPKLSGKIMTATIVFNNAQNTPKHTNVSTYTTIQKIGETGEIQLRLPAGKYVIATSENPGFALISNDIKLKSRNDGVILLGIRSTKWIQEAPQSYEILKTRFKVLNLKSGKTLQLL